MRIWLALAIIYLLTLPATAQSEILAEKLRGRILIQTEQKGEAWYVYPGDLKRRYLGRPSDAFSIMRSLGLGITNRDLEKIAPATLDKDGDNDGWSDKTEVENGYDPLVPTKTVHDTLFTGKHLGKIFLQVKKKGEAWYVNPADQKRYYLGRPDDAFAIMRALGLGITDAELAKIPAFVEPIPVTPPPDSGSGPDQAMAGAASAIRANDPSGTAKYFLPAMAKAVEHTVETLGDEGRLLLGNILSGSTKNGSCTETCTYTNKAYFSLGGYDVPLKFIVKKQPDGSWLITNL